jgi:hypothetical protein
MHFALTEVSMLSLVLACVGAAPAGPAQAPTVAELIAGIQRQADSHRDVQYEYAVEARFWPYPGLATSQDGQEVVGTTPSQGRPRHIASRDVLKLLRSNAREQPLPWHFWSRSVRAEDGTWVVDRWVSCEGLHTVEYRAGPTAGTDLYGNARFYPGHYWPLLEENIFEQLLLGNAYGLCYYQDPEGHVTHGAATNHLWSIEGETTACGRRCFLLMCRWQAGDAQVTTRMAVTASAPHVIVRSETTLERDHVAKVLQSREIVRLGRLDHIVYPAAGKLTQAEINASRRMEYHFTVTGARRIGESVRKTWRPPWPPGTHVSNPLNDEYYTIPYSPEQRRRLAATQAAQERLRPGSASSVSRRFALLFNLAMLLVFVAALLIYRHKRRGARAAERVEP